MLPLSCVPSVFPKCTSPVTLLPYALFDCAPCRSLTRVCTSESTSKSKRGRAGKKSSPSFWSRAFFGINGHSTTSSLRLLWSADTTCTRPILTGECHCIYCAVCRASPGTYVLVFHCTVRCSMPSIRSQRPFSHSQPPGFECQGLVYRGSMETLDISP
jgi:hypothetical protein